MLASQLCLQGIARYNIDILTVGDSVLILLSYIICLLIFTYCRDVINDLSSGCVRRLCVRSFNYKLLENDLNILFSFHV